ncbi:type IV pilus biogenesis protein PilM [Hydrogenophilus thiooxidans]|uniref:type IV pilus biogenesis protein PilM n=1 Tax=Hydrogenophilus thiooxidans TaxID=2820326 RepID=UPI002016A7F5|nr:type IV pilus assembly protein PilM [Hydrogenophilus thiooxidans]
MLRLGRHQKTGEGVGIDLGPSAVKAVKLERRREAVALASVATVPCESGWYSAAGVGNQKAVVRALMQVGQMLGGVRAAVMALPDSAVMQRSVVFPAGLSEREEEEQVLAELARMSPFPVEELRADWQVVGPGAEPETERVVIVATRQERVEAMQLLAEEAGFALAHLDVEGLALRRAALRAELLSGVTALIDAGEETIELVVWVNGERRFDRSQSFEAGRVRRDLARFLRSNEAATQMLSSNRWSEAANAEVLQPFLAKFAFEVANLLKFFLTASEGVAQINRVLIAGGVAALPGVVDAVQSMVSPPVALLNPWVKLSVAARWQEWLPVAPRFALATGLAWRGVA